MSDYESHSGKLRLVEAKENETFEQQCKRLWVENGEPEENYEEGELFSEFYEKYFQVKGRVWEVFDHEESDDDDTFCKLNMNGDGTITFHTRFYNGGTCMSEMVEDELERIPESYYRDNKLERILK
jgi:hypothetical protein